jgi:serine/threonine protein kinase
MLGLINNTCNSISGYMAPELALESVFSVKSDVFSFGVLLLEILSREFYSMVSLIFNFMTHRKLVIVPRVHLFSLFKYAVMSSKMSM